MALRLTPADALVQRVGTRKMRSTPPRRGKITTWTRRSRQGLKLALRGVEGLTHFVSLTYGADYPTDPDVIRNHWERIRKWFVRRCFRGIWRREIQKRGALHYHVLLGGMDDIDVVALGKAWARITGSSDATHGVDVSVIRNRYAVNSYLAKLDAMAGDGKAIGRYWGLFGKAEIAIKAEVVGDVAAVAKIVRVARHLERAQRRGAGLHRQQGGDGRWGCIYWGVSQALLRALPRLILLYDLSRTAEISFGP